MSEPDESTSRRSDPCFDPILCSRISLSSRPASVDTAPLRAPLHSRERTLRIASAGSEELQAFALSLSFIRDSGCFHRQQIGSQARLFDHRAATVPPAARVHDAGPQLRLITSRDSRPDLSSLMGHRASFAVPHTPEVSEYRRPGDVSISVSAGEHTAASWARGSWRTAAAGDPFVAAWSGRKGGRGKAVAVGCVVLLGWLGLVQL